MKTVISTQNAPAAIGPYSQGIQAGSLIITSGQLPIDPATGAFPATIEEQTRQSLTKKRTIYFKIRIFRCRTNQNHCTIFHKW